MFITPCKQQKQKQIFGTPLNVPASPFLKQLGYGTGVQVFRFERQPDATGSTKSPWALKCLSRRHNNDPDSKTMISSRLLEEADILRSLNHPNIVGFRGLKKLQDGRDTLIMEECSASLGDLLEERHDDKLGPLPADQMRKVCLDMCEALKYLHDTVHLLHGDIKSFNVLIKNDFEICKLCDFGVSLPLNADGYIDLVKKPDAKYIGTGCWCAPEALIDDNVQSISSKADIFSFGLVLYECIACVPPHTYATDDGDTDDVEKTEDSDANESSDLEDEDGFDFEALMGTRPPLPVVESLDKEYNMLIEIFYLCTNEAPEDRPTAGCLADALKTYFSQ
ncbi:lymphokine-activated killer T-cell-originated protein kinase [Bradysia coprophila]|uniref:lymphokine-activated killer T-cell-originated protein kinase n=1 Tax=Bradysia coprophila TaxID=38358 RepID=UPI00187DB4D5|nr:lymphokine-activated killer T-cell-originated protein kinase [Bradysia coprophila]